MPGPCAQAFLLPLCCLSWPVFFQHSCWGFLQQTRRLLKPVFPIWRSSGLLCSDADPACYTALCGNCRGCLLAFGNDLSVVMVGMSYQMPTNGGIIRGSGSIAYSMKVDLISTWGIVILLSMFMAFVVKASPAVVVCCLNADQIFKCVPAFLKCNYGHWIKNMTN